MYSACFFYRSRSNKFLKNVDDSTYFEFQLPAKIQRFKKNKRKTHTIFFFFVVRYRFKFNRVQQNFVTNLRKKNQM